MPSSTTAPRASVVEAVQLLDRWISNNGWQGYDPYDIRGTKPFLILLQRARDLLNPLAQWSIDKMQTAAGSFAFMRRRGFGREIVHDFPYLRWGQGWMLLALSQYLLVEK